MGATLALKPYQPHPENPNWDHDHCEFCTAKFTIQGDLKGLREGFTTEDGYRWICQVCFEDFKNEFQWNVVRSEDPDDNA